MSQLLFFITVSVAHLLDAYKKQSVRSWAVVCLVVQQFFEFLFEVCIRTNADHVAKRVRSPSRLNIFHTVFVIEFQQPSAQRLHAHDAIQACGILLYRNSYCHQRKKQGTPGHLTEASQDLPQHLVPSPAAVDQLKQQFLSINHTALSGRERITY